ncbi:Protein ECERIFERUM 26 [Morella rubra]|uniref:Protein ECERIFERUM 26 n=2 Tax=Morella rubra TaxID=262757 RepID=A0A6A1VL32_9ROSI|nr:Protein ECERIFERUM 26 [Morella rubra]
MAFSEEDKLVYGNRICSVGPGRLTGSDRVHYPSSIDLAMKLHYVKGLYFFSSHAAEGLTPTRLKETMFEWFCHEYYYTSGRLRKSESGRPYLKCNDCGARFIEAQCDKTIDEWLELDKDCSLQRLLVSQQVIGPELSFSPLVLIQVTYFQCGGISLGLSWAHILGDAFSAADFMNKWGKIVAGLQSNKPNFLKSDTLTERSKDNPKPLPQEPLSVKRVNPVGDHWIIPNNSKMATFSFPVTATQLANLQLEISGPNQIDQIPVFESLCAIIWKSLAKVRGGTRPEAVTICKNSPSKPAKGTALNTQIISKVKAGSFSITETDPRKLATLLLNEAVDERSLIEELVEKDHGVSDFVVYGAKLTFVNLEEADFYGLELNGDKPEVVHYSVQGVGDEGAVFVLPGPKGSGIGKGGGEGRIVKIVLPEEQVLELKAELVNYGLGGHDLP